MAELTKSNTDGRKFFLPSKADASAKIGQIAAGLTLPTEGEPAAADFDQAHILVHGEKKIGKTTLAMAVDGALLLTFDPKQKWLKDVMQRHCPSWEIFVAYLVKLEEAVRKGDFPYKRVVIDGVDIWYRLCQTTCERKLAVDFIGEDGLWGKGYDMLKLKFSEVVDRLLALPCGCWFISHSAWKEVQTRIVGVKVTKLLPLMKGGAEEILVGRVDGWFAYDYWEKNRILIVRGDERTGAGNRVEGHFFTPKGRPVIEIPMGTTARIGHDNLITAFNNQQTFVTMAELNKRNENLALRPVKIKYLPVSKKGGK